MRKALKPFEWRVRTFKYVLITLLVVFISLIVVVRTNSESDVVWAETSRVGTDKQVVARAGTERMEEFFKRVETDLHILAHSMSEVGIDPEEEVGLMEVVVDRYEDTPFASLVHVSGDGEVLHSVNRDRKSVELVDVSDREYFLWAREQKSKDSVFLSSPIVARAGPLKGEKAVVVAVPLFDESEFDGLVFAAISLEMLVSDYVSNLAVYEGTDYLLLDSEGIVLGGMNRQDLFGKHILEVCYGENPGTEQEQAFHEAAVSAILSGNNSWGELITHLGEDEEQWIVGYAPFEFGEQEWFLSVLVVKDEVNGRIGKYHTTTKYGLVIVSLGFVALGLLSLLGMRRAQIVWFKRGFEQSKKLIKQAKKGVGV